MTFKEWVEKWQIGPGMNDNHPGTQKFLEELAVADSKYLKRFNESSKRQLDLRKKELYSGFDGEVGPGWVPILDRLAEDLIKMGWDRDLHQVKEKFGTLRFYVGRSTEEMEDRISQAEDESAVTCEECGAPGKTGGRGWIKTLCSDCRKKWDESRGR